MSRLTYCARGCFGVFSNRTRDRPIRGAARALIRWSSEDLAHSLSVGLTAIRRAELTIKETSLAAANNLAIRRALESADVEFIDENGGGPGVRLRKPAKPKR